MFQHKELVQERQVSYNGRPRGLLWFAVVVRPVCRKVVSFARSVAELFSQCQIARALHRTHCAAGDVGVPYLAGSQFCPKCGEDVSAFAQSVSVESLFREPRGKVSLAAWFLLPGLLLSLAWLAMTDNPVSEQFERIFHRTHAESIGPEVFSVDPGSFAYFKFDGSGVRRDRCVGKRPVQRRQGRQQ